ncbi:MAG: elongation factor 4 [Deltaproteobacteria bacterium]|jgi:GTP-binding protein LepA|nr:MAG: elongation factor 4 [Deltaproteobacteria bacterium]
MKTDQRRIRNFSIIAHIDHGKSTLADRFLEITGIMGSKAITPQFLDKMDLERERGITIKAQTVRLPYTADDNETYILNLIDTPGHVDFSYEVYHSLAACDGAVLVIDASQGVEAQTLANVYMAHDSNLTVLPVINKIDLPSANPDKVKEEIEDIICIESDDAILISAKEGIGIREVLEAIIQKIPPPGGRIEAPLKALIFDSWFDPYQGAIVLIRVFDGTIEKGMNIQMMSSKKIFEVARVGIFSPDMIEVSELSAGEVGFVIAGIKEVKDTRMGDTITDAENPTDMPFPGFRIMKPMVFCGLYPIASAQFDVLRNALEKLQLNDASFSYEPETSLALGFGFRCGFLGLLHMEIIQERLEREYGLNLITTAPNVIYQVTTTGGHVLNVENPSKLPSLQELVSIREPYVLATIYLPNSYVGAVLKLCEEKRGIQKQIKYLSIDRVVLTYELPLNEILFDFYDRLKSASRGYASFDYEHLDFRESDMVKLDILINGDMVDAFSLITHKENAYFRAKSLVAKMKDLIPRQMFEVVIQGAIGSKVIARETIRPLRKNVTAKCYGGDITRKRKLLEKQKEGKKRMKQIGKVEIPQEAFLAILK